LSTEPRWRPSANHFAAAVARTNFVSANRGEERRSRTSIQLPDFQFRRHAMLQKVRQSMRG
jgi:hypothetical protein